MQIVELNPPGNFDIWDPEKLKELNQKQSSNILERGLLFENDAMRLRVVRLNPKECLPFHKRVQYYSWTCLTDGIALSRYGDGSILMVRFNQCETNYWDLGAEGTIADLENIGESTLELHFIEYIVEPNNEQKFRLVST